MQIQIKKLWSRRSFIVAASVLVFSLWATTAFASSDTTNSIHPAETFFWIAIILVGAKLSGLVERFGQPPVLGELLLGVLLGNLSLLGIKFFEPLGSNEIIHFLAELGVVILLFQIGLESNIGQMKKVGLRAFLVACIGVVVPFILGTYVAGPLLLPGLSFNAYLFIGATLTATSVGITARVFKDLKKLQTPEAQIVLGAAVIDDVLGLIILAVVSAIVTTGAAGLGLISVITAKAILFLIGSILVGQISAPLLGKWFSRVNQGTGMKFTLAIAFGLVLAYLAQQIGLAPIVGAFAAGLVLDPIHFRYFRDPQVVVDVEQATANFPVSDRQKITDALEHHADRHIEDLIEPVGYLLVPIFFVMTGFGVKVDVLFNLPIVLVALGVTAVAFIGKIVAGVVAGKVDKLIVGFGMIPRGEVGLIFAVMGQSLGVVSDEVFSIIVIMVIISTLCPPPILTYLLKRKSEAETARA